MLMENHPDQHVAPSEPIDLTSYDLDYTDPDVIDMVLSSENDKRLFELNLALDKLWRTQWEDIPHDQLDPKTFFTEREHIETEIMQRRQELGLDTGP